MRLNDLLSWKRMYVCMYIQTLDSSLIRRLFQWTSAVKIPATEDLYSVCQALTNGRYTVCTPLYFPINELFLSRETARTQNVSSLLRIVTYRRVPIPV
jgi:hypothetical protein